MVLSKATCPECCERVVVDIVNSYGYCMYCGYRIDTEDSTPLPSAFRNALKVELEDMKGFSDWYASVVSAFDTIFQGDMESGIVSLRKVIDENMDDLEEVLNSIDTQAIEWVVNGVDCDNIYRGGVLRIVDLMNEYEEVPPKIFLSLIIMQMGIKSRSITNPVVAKDFIVSLFNVILEYIPFLNNVGDIINTCEQINTILQQSMVTAYPRGEVEDDEAFRCGNFLHQLCLTLIIRIDHMTQKEVVKVNRALMTKDLTAAMDEFHEAFMCVSDGRDYTDHIMAYVRNLLDDGAPVAPRKKVGKKGRN